MMTLSALVVLAARKVEYAFKISAKEKPTHHVSRWHGDLSGLIERLTMGDQLFSRELLRGKELQQHGRRDGVDQPRCDCFRGEDVSLGPNRPRKSRAGA